MAKILPVGWQPAAEPQLRPVESLAALIERYAALDAVAHVVQPTVEIEIQPGNDGVVHAEIFVDQSISGLDHEVEGDQLAAMPVEEDTGCGRQRAQQLREIVHRQIFELQVAVSNRLPVKSGHLRLDIVDLAALFDANVLEGSELASHVPAGRLAQTVEVGFEIGKGQVEHGRRQTGQPGEAAGQQGASPQSVVARGGVLDAQQAIAVDGAKLAQRDDDAREQRQPIIGRRLGSEAEVADFGDRRAQRDQAQRQQAWGKPIELVGYPLPGPLNGGVEAIFSPEGRHDRYRAAILPDGQVMPRETGRPGLFAGPIKSPVLRIGRKAAVPVRAVEGGDRVLDDGGQSHDRSRSSARPGSRGASRRGSLRCTKLTEWSITRSRSRSSVIM